MAHDGEFVGVAAPSEQAASRALAAIRAEWKTSAQPSGPELFDYLKRKADPVKEPLSSLVAELPTSTLVHRQLPCPWAQKGLVMRVLSERLKGRDAEREKSDSDDQADQSSHERLSERAAAGTLAALPGSHGGIDDTV